MFDAELLQDKAVVFAFEAPGGTHSHQFAAAGALYEIIKPSLAVFIQALNDVQHVLKMVHRVDKFNTLKTYASNFVFILVQKRLGHGLGRIVVYDSPCKKIRIRFGQTL